MNVLIVIGLRIPRNAVNTKSVEIVQTVRVAIAPAVNKNLQVKKNVHILRRGKMKNIIGTTNNFKIGNREYSVSGYTTHLGYEDIILMSTKAVNNDRRCILCKSNTKSKLRGKCAECLQTEDLNEFILSDTLSDELYRIIRYKNLKF